MNTVSEMFVSRVAQDMNVEHVVTDICLVLEDAKVPRAGSEALRGILLQCATASDAVNRLM